MKTKFIFILFVLFILVNFSIFSSFGADPKLVTTLTKAFDKLKDYIIKISTPAAAVAVGTGVLMKKFSFGDEEKIRTAKRLIRGSLFSYAFILCIDLVLSLIKALFG